MANSLNFMYYFIMLLCFLSYGAMGSENLAQPNLQIQCQTDKDCQVTDTNDYICKNNVCECSNEKCEKNPFVLSTPVAKIGEPCKGNLHQCIIKLSFCNKKGMCDCIKNTVSSANKRHCLKVMVYGATCEEDVQCGLFNGNCIDNKCICDKNKHFLNGNCYNSVELDSKCHKDEECALTEYSVCKEHLCSCMQDYVMASSKSACLPKAKTNGSECSEDIQCTSVLGQGAICSKRTCRCGELYQYNTNSNECVLDTLLGGKCNEHEECHQPGDGERRLECVLGECKCKSPYTEKSGYCVLNSADGSTELNSIFKLFPYILSYILFLIIF